VEPAKNCDLLPELGYDVYSVGDDAGPAP